MTVEWHLQDKTPDFVTSGIDCAIQVGYVDDPAVVAIRLAEVPRIVVAAPYLLGKDSVGENIESLKQVPWLALQTYYRDEVSLSKISGGENFRFSIRPRLCTDSLYAIRRAAIAGLGACIVSAWIVDEDLKLGRLVHLMPQWQAQPLPVYLVYPQARFYPAKLRKFIELMRSRIPTLVGLRAHTR
jgi:DNA-binding transcriptional LysR family regulator